MSFIEVGLFVFEAIHRQTNTKEKFEKYGKSRFNAWQELEKEKGKSYHIIWS
jgi:hypothetical protein